LHLKHSRFQQTYDAFGFLEKRGTFTRQFDMPTRSVKQPHSNTTLKILNRSRQRRLRDTNRRRGLTEVQTLSDRYEMAQLPNFWRTDTHCALIRAQ
jgi:hypothetical protein